MQKLARIDLRSRKYQLKIPCSQRVVHCLTKHLAKIASQVAKPDGLLVVDPLTELEFLHGLPVELMWGVGPATKARLSEIGVLTIGQLAETSPRSLDRLLGRAASDKLSALAWTRSRISRVPGRGSSRDPSTTPSTLPKLSMR